jgi:hypothetical protein
VDEWSARRRNLYLKTHNTHKRHSCFPRDSNPQLQQASGRRPTPQTAQPLGSAITPIASVWYTPDSPTLYSPNNGISQLQDVHDQNKAPREVHTVMLFGLSSNVVAEGTKRPHGHQDGWIYYLSPRSGHDCVLEVLIFVQSRNSCSLLKLFPILFTLFHILTGSEIIFFLSFQSKFFLSSKHNS